MKRVVIPLSGSIDRVYGYISIRATLLSKYPSHHDEALACPIRLALISSLTLATATCTSMCLPTPSLQALSSSTISAPAAPPLASLRLLSTSSNSVLEAATSLSKPRSRSSSPEFDTSHAFRPNVSSKARFVERDERYAAFIEAVRTAEVQA